MPGPVFTVTFYFFPLLSYSILGFFLPHHAGKMQRADTGVPGDATSTRGLAPEPRTLQLRPGDAGREGRGRVGEDPSGAALPAQGHGAGPGPPATAQCWDGLRAACPLAFGFGPQGPPARACFCSISKASLRSPAWSSKHLTHSPSAAAPAWERGQGPLVFARQLHGVETDGASVSRISRGRFPGQIAAPTGLRAVRSISPVCPPSLQPQQLLLECPLPSPARLGSPGAPLLTPIFLVRADPGGLNALCRPPVGKTPRLQSLAPSSGLAAVATDEAPPSRPTPAHVPGAQRGRSGFRHVHTPPLIRRHPWTRPQSGRMSSRPTRTRRFLGTPMSAGACRRLSYLRANAAPTPTPSLTLVKSN